MFVLIAALSLILPATVSSSDVSLNGDKPISDVCADFFGHPKLELAASVFSEMISTDETGEKLDLAAILGQAAVDPENCPVALYSPQVSSVPKYLGAQIDGGLQLTARGTCFTILSSKELLFIAVLKEIQGTCEKRLSMFMERDNDHVVNMAAQLALHIQFPDVIKAVRSLLARSSVDVADSFFENLLRGNHSPNSRALVTCINQSVVITSDKFEMIMLMEQVTLDTLLNVYDTQSAYSIKTSEQTSGCIIHPINWESRLLVPHIQYLNGGNNAPPSKGMTVEALHLMIVSHPLFNGYIVEAVSVLLSKITSHFRWFVPITQVSDLDPDNQIATGVLSSDNEYMCITMSPESMVSVIKTSMLEISSLPDQVFPNFLIRQSRPNQLEFTYEENGFSVEFTLDDGTLSCFLILQHPYRHIALRARESVVYFAYARLHCGTEYNSSIMNIFQGVSFDTLKAALETFPRDIFSQVSVVSILQFLESALAKKTNFENGMELLVAKNFDTPFNVTADMASLRIISSGMDFGFLKRSKQRFVVCYGDSAIGVQESREIIVYDSVASSNTSNSSSSSSSSSRNHLISSSAASSSNPPVFSSSSSSELPTLNISEPSPVQNHSSVSSSNSGNHSSSSSVAVGTSNLSFFSSSQFLDPTSQSRTIASLTTSKASLTISSVAPPAVAVSNGMISILEQILLHKSFDSVILGLVLKMIQCAPAKYYGLVSRAKASEMEHTNTAVIESGNLNNTDKVRVIHSPELLQQFIASLLKCTLRQNEIRNASYFYLTEEKYEGADAIAIAYRHIPNNELETFKAFLFVRQENLMCIFTRLQHRENIPCRLAKMQYPPGCQMYAGAKHLEIIRGVFSGWGKSRLLASLNGKVSSERLAIIGEIFDHQICPRHPSVQLVTFSEGCNGLDVVVMDFLGTGDTLSFIRESDKSITIISATRDNSREPFHYSIQ